MQLLRPFLSQSDIQMQYKQNDNKISDNIFTRASSSVVEHSAHNGYVVGSIPTWPICEYSLVVKHQFSILMM